MYSLWDLSKTILYSVRNKGLGLLLKILPGVNISTENVKLFPNNFSKSKTFPSQITLDHSCPEG